jgi:hypothetical protein
LTHTAKLAAGSDSFLRPIPHIHKGNPVHFDLHHRDANAGWNATRQRNASEAQAEPVAADEEHHRQTATRRRNQGEVQTAPVTADQGRPQQGRDPATQRK